MELKLNKVKWQRGNDFIDNSAIYTFDNRYPATTDADIAVIIYSEREYVNGVYGDKKRYYYGNVVNRTKETADKIGRFETLKEAKIETLKLFNEYMDLFPDDETWYRKLRLSLHPDKYESDGMTLKS